MVGFSLIIFCPVITSNVQKSLNKMKFNFTVQSSTGGAECEGEAHDRPVSWAPPVWGGSWYQHRLRPREVMEELSLHLRILEAVNMRGAEWVLVLVALLVVAGIAVGRASTKNGAGTEHSCPSGAPPDALNSFGSLAVAERFNGHWARFTEGISLIPRVDFKASESYGRVYLRNWTSELNLPPPCYIQGGEGVFEANSTAKVFYNAMLCTSNSSETSLMNSQCNGRESLRGRVELPAGRVYLAMYVVPTGNASWDRWDHVYCSDVVDFLSVCGHPEKWVRNFKVPCHCGVESVLSDLKERIEKAGFEQVSSARVNGSGVFSEVHRLTYRGSKGYLYLEVAGINGMDAARVLVVMGDEKIVKAVSGLFLSS